jgi:RNA polymerase sigma-70 factor (ECF subfamily)
MSERPDSTTQLQHWLDQMREGDAAAGEALVQHACERLRRLTRKMLRGYPDLNRWEQTDDVLQNALLRLHRALAKVQPETVAGFFRLAAKLIRQELIDLGRHYLGPQGLGGNHASSPDLVDVLRNVRASISLHELVEGLAAEEREVVDLLFYQGMTEREAAAALGVSERTVKRRWRSARLALYQDLRDDEALA